MDKPQDTTPQSPPESRPARAASPRLAVALAAGMLALGIAVGAAIGPAPSASFAGDRSALVGRLAPLLATLGHLGQSGTPAPRSSPATPPPPPRNAGSRPLHHRRRHARRAVPALPSTPEPAVPSTPSTEVPTSSSGTGPGTSPGKTKPASLPPVTNVWLIELAGSSFTEALAAPAEAPYIDSQAIPSGSLLSGWSGLAASAFASEAALLASRPPQLAETIVQPPCPEGAAGASCAADTPGAVKAADAFLQATIPTITSTAAYKAKGLIVVTFASVVTPTATGLPAGASAATVTAEPPAGALLISPFAKPGARPSAPFAPASPTRSLEGLLHQ